VNPIGEEHDEELTLGVDPQGGPGESGVAEGAIREELPGRGACGGLGIPAQSPGRLGHPGSRGELLHQPPRCDALVVVDPSPEDHLGKASEILGGAEEASVRRHASQGMGVFVVHLAVHHPAPPWVLLRWGDAGPQLARRAKERVFHPQGREEPTRHEALQALAGYPFQCLAQEDHPEVTIEALGSRLVHQVLVIDALQDGLPPFRLQVEGSPPVHPRGVGQEVAYGDLLLAGPPKSRQDALQRSLQLESPFVHQDHRHGGRGDDLGEAGEVVEGVGRDRGSVLGPGVAPEGLQMDEGSLAPHGEDTAGEGTAGHEILQHGVHLGHRPGSEADLLGERGLEGQAAPRKLDPVAPGSDPGKRHRQPTADRRLAQEGRHHRALAGLLGPVGAEVGRHLGHLGEQVGRSERDEQKRGRGGRQAAQQRPLALAREGALFLAAADEGGDDDVAVAGGGGDQLVEGRRRDLRAQ
jgi:hypothetical protein